MLHISIVELLVMIVILPLLGGVIGYVVGVDRAGRGRDADEVQAVREEFDDYKQGVTTHFQQTAELMQRMTEQYRTLYTHMAKSSMSLCDARDEPSQLEEFNRPGLVIEEQSDPADESVPRAAPRS